MAPKAKSNRTSQQLIADYLPPPPENSYRVIAIDSSNQSRLQVSASDLVKLACSPGDPVIISSANHLPDPMQLKAIGTIWPARDLTGGSIRVGRLLASTFGLPVPFLVSLQAVKSSEVIPEALKVVIKQTEGPPIRRDATFEIYVKSCLVNASFITRSQQVHLVYETVERIFTVESFEPVLEQAIAYRVCEKTIIITKPMLKPIVTTKAGDLTKIGGLDDQIRVLCEFLDLSLRQPQRYTQFGLRPPRGILLYGPSGTGKTVLAKAVAQSSGMYVTTINGSDIASSYYGETEAKLREVFEDASASSPAIILLDDVDALCPRRDGDVTEAERRAVATMLTLLDGVSQKAESDTRLIVIGTTNRVDAVDEAMRRPGRFDRELEIGIPTAISRYHILEALLRNVPHSIAQPDLQLVANAAHAYVGSDLFGVVQEASLKAIQRCIESGLTEPCMTIEDLRTGLGDVRPSAMREVYVEVPQVFWTDVGGQSEIKQKLIEAVAWPLKHPESFLRFGIRPPRGLLLYGPPGCSKTLMAKALATETKVNFISIKGPELYSKYVGESEKAVRETFRRARAAAPSIVFFDEIDAMGSKRGSSTDGSSSDRVLAQLLAEIDGVESMNGVTVLAATNRPDILDSALLRPGRIDRILYVAPPDYASRYEILQVRTRTMSLSDDVDLAQIAELTHRFSGAEVVAVCQEAAVSALDENIDASEDQWRTVEQYAEHNIQFFENLNSFLKKRASIEQEYATSLTKLVKAHKDEYTKKSTDKSAGSFQKAVLSSTVAQSWLQLLNETENMASSHTTISEKMELDLRKPLKIRLKENEKNNKTNFDEIRRLLAELRKSVEIMEKTRERYETATKAANTARSTYETASTDAKRKKEDVEKIRADMEKKTVLEKEAMEAYKKSIAETNDKKNKHYQEQLPAILDIIQRDDEKDRIVVAKELLIKFAELESTQLPVVSACTQSMISTAQTITPKYDTDLFVKLMRTGDPTPPDYVFEGVGTENVLKAFTKHTKAESNVEESIITLPERKGRKRAVERLKQLDKDHAELEKKRQGYLTLLSVSSDISHDPKIQKDLSDQRSILDQQLEAVLIKKHKLYVYLATLDGTPAPSPPDLISVKLGSPYSLSRPSASSTFPPTTTSTITAPTNNNTNLHTIKIRDSVQSEAARDSTSNNKSRDSIPEHIHTSRAPPLSVISVVTNDDDMTPRISKSHSFKTSNDLKPPCIPETSPAKRVSSANIYGRGSESPPSAANIVTPAPIISTAPISPPLPSSANGMSEPDSPAKVDLVRQLMISHQEAKAASSEEEDTSSLATPLSSTGNLFGRARALYEFVGSNDPDSSELPLSVGDEVDLLEKLEDGWWRVRKGSKEGFCPGSYMEEIV
ncbi:hypothetical protein SmJEL517_g05473 [Synchytrium microbalum]|uniref:SH3 domain-containing protein n=1 Tax=Synchytrium microbalum TaxID=1806994 RepID=A0A507BU87_9FUNG|nr:uncharacterized protein SmJEL517_g05473 [Synchytrium microbalum]TPX31132.1 hypothetical protein SmJEL517_g05473 [Synchytrium microbalum]